MTRRIQTSLKLINTPPLINNKCRRWLVSIRIDWVRINNWEPLSFKSSWWSPIKTGWRSFRRSFYQPPKGIVSHLPILYTMRTSRGTSQPTQLILSDSRRPQYSMAPSIELKWKNKCNCFHNLKIGFNPPPNPRVTLKKRDLLKSNRWTRNKLKV